MRFRELNDDQRLQLKQKMLDDELYQTEGRSASYGELGHAESLVTDEALEEEYGGTSFSPEDFFG